MNKFPDGKQKPVTILIVDDSKTQLERLRFLLEDENYRVLTASNGKEGLAVARGTAIDLLISDIVMPEMDGYELCKTLRVDPGFRNLPVILLTSLSDPQDVVRGLESGANNFICKPYDDQALLARVQNVLTNQEIRKSSTSEMGINIFFAGHQFFITADRLQILDLLLSTYENAVTKNGELHRARDELRILNEQLEARVTERTAALTAETAERRRGEERERHLNLVLRAIRNVNKLIVHEKDPARLTQDACDLLIETRGYLAAYIVRKDESGKTFTLTQSGLGTFAAAFATRLGQGHSPACWGKALGADNGFAMIDPLRECQECPLWEVDRFGQVAVSMLNHGGKSFGMLGVYLAKGAAIDEEERSLLVEVAGDIGLALHGIETEKSRLESEEKLRAISNSAQDAIILSEGSGKIAFWNPSAERLFGYSEQEALGRNVDELIISDGSRLPYEQALEEFHRTGREATIGRVIELTVKHRDGGDFPVEVALSSVPLNGQFWACALIRDIRERRRTEKVREKLEEQLRVSQKMEAIGSLAGGVAHDFNNLLSVILGYLEFSCENLREGDPLRDDLREAVKAAERASVLTRQLLAFSRKQILQPISLDLNQVARGLEKMLVRILGEDIELVHILAPDLGCVMADPSQVEQVIMNLVVNARDAMPRGGKLTIETANVEFDEEFSLRNALARPGPYVLLAVTDTGCGMDEVIRAHIFEPFFTTKGEGKGTGLGLSTVYGIVRQSQGRIHAYSEPGKGTSFKIYFPREVAALQGVVTAPMVRAPTGGTETILLVEDEEGVRRLTHRMLTNAGYVVLAKRSGGEAVLTCEQHQGEIHLLLTDVVMPEMSGKALAERVTKVCPRIKVLFMSGYTNNAIAHHGILDPGTAFIGKPFSGGDLLRKVREVLDQGEANPLP